MTARNADQLREKIDRGETGDKVDFPDPAAAPLGTDDEAAGRPPQRADAEPPRVKDHPAVEAGSRKPAGSRVMVLILSGAAVTALALIAVASL